MVLTDFAETQSQKIDLAERGGFEPPVDFKGLRRFSKPLLSTTQPPLQSQSAWCDTMERISHPVAPVAQLDRAFASEAKGHKFESCRAHQNRLFLCSSSA